MPHHRLGGGPAAEYCVPGTQAAMYDFAEGGLLPPVLDRLCDGPYALRAQVRAGADVIGIGDAVCSLLGPGCTGNTASPMKNLIDHPAGGALAKLHLQGYLPPLGRHQRNPPHIVDVDWMVNWGDACRRLSRAAPAGTDPVAVMLRARRGWPGGGRVLEEGTGAPWSAPGASSAGHAQGEPAGGP